MIILVTNDDGILAPGLKALEEAVRPFGDVWVVAPERDRSAISHAISLDRPLRAQEIEPRRFACSGTPADCVYLGMHRLCPQKPDLVVSGVNAGGNLGTDVIYSGTVQAAAEASLVGVPAMAFSVVAHRNHNFAPATRFARALVEAHVKNPFPPGTLLNVNVPQNKDKPGPDAFVWTRLGRRRYAEMVEDRADPRNRTYYWTGGHLLGFEDIPGSDCNAAHDNLISITPLHFDHTHYPELGRLRAMPLDGHRLVEGYVDVDAAQR